MKPRITEQLLGPPTHEYQRGLGAPDTRAAKLYEMWHKKEPNGIHVLKYEFPDTVCCVGTAVSILYHSDKWEEDGHGYDYEHDFESGPKVYAPADCELFARSNPVHDTSKILRADIHGDVPLPMLAVVREFVFKDVRGAEKTLRFTSHTPLMCMTHDKKGLVIFTNLGDTETPIFVRGGDMHVTSHGIIK